MQRFRRALEFVDYLRLDHFRGFEAYWELPASARSAGEGRWMKGPGKRFFEALEETLGNLPLVAEDLGFITPEVENLKHIFQLPGMKVYQFSYNEMFASEEKHVVYYTGTMITIPSGPGAGKIIFLGLGNLQNRGDNAARILCLDH